VINLTVAALKVAKRGEAPLDVIPTRQSGVEVEYLVNNAGFDVFGYAIERDRAE
jgi:short-subunit dehydrogenase